MNFTDKILITGARGLVGGALIRELTGQGHTNLVPVGKDPAICWFLTMSGNFSSGRAFQFRRRRERLFKRTGLIVER